MTAKEAKENGYKTMRQVLLEVNKKQFRSNSLPDNIKYLTINGIKYFDNDNAKKLKDYLLLSKGEKKRTFLKNKKSTSGFFYLKKIGYKSFNDLLKEENKCSNFKFLPEELKQKRINNLFSPKDQEAVREWIKKDKEQKIKETCIKKYGANSPFEAFSIKQKIKENCIKKYGVDNPFKLQKFQAKARETNKKNHNGLYNSQTKEWSNACKFKRKQLYKYNNIVFDSSWELVYYFYLKYNNIPCIYHPEQLIYEENGKNKFYEPDFKVYDRFVEIKGEHLLKDGKLYNPFLKKFLKEKQKCLDDNNVLLLTKEDIKPFFAFAKNKNFDFNSYRVEIKK